MCDPVTLAIVASTAVSAYGQKQQGDYANQVAKNNATTQGYMAADAIKRGERDEQRHRLQVAQMKSEQRAAFGASGRDISGSAENIIADTAMMGELDALTLRSNAQREAYGHEVSAVNYKAEGKLAKKQGKYAAAGSLLSGAGSASASFKKYN